MTDEQSPIKVKYERLHELIEKTAKNRFLASSRLIAHKHWSSWTVTIMTICVIGLSMIQSMDIGHAQTNQMMSFAIVMLSTFILVYSITMSMSEFSLRAHQFHQCGLELMKLRGSVFGETQKKEEGYDKYKTLNDQYGTILDKYENHSTIDFLRMQISSKTQREYYKHNLASYMLIKARYWASYWHYVLLVAASLAYFIAMANKTVNWTP